MNLVDSPLLIRDRMKIPTETFLEAHFNQEKVLPQEIILQLFVFR